MLIKIGDRNTIHILLSRINILLLRTLLKGCISYVFLIFPFVVSSQSIVDDREEFHSKYGYSILIPKAFSKGVPKQKNTDLLFTDEYGASININVTSRLKEEYAMDMHSCSKESFQKGMRTAYPNYTITRWEKMYVDGEKTFVTEAVGLYGPELTYLSYFFFNLDKAYVITCAAVTTNFDNYRGLFKNAVKSVKLKK